MKTTGKSYIKTLLPFAGLVLLYFVTRLIGLTALPIGSEEAVWIHWAQIIVQYPSEFLISGDSGRQPLFTWLVAVVLNLFPDPLAAGRFVAVLAGLASLIGLYVTWGRLYNRAVGFLVAFLYIVIPFTYSLDRLAQPDGLMSAFGIWMFRWSLHIAQQTQPSGRAYKVLGVIVGAMLLTQISALILLPILFLVFYFWQVHRRPQFWRSFGVCIGIALAVNLPALLNASYKESAQLHLQEGEPSGYGVREAAQFLAKEAEAFRKKTGVPLPVLLPMSPGNPAEGITVYLWKHPDVRFVPVFWWPKSPRMIPTGLRFSHRPSIHQTSPVTRRETTLLDYAHFIFPDADYSREKFLQENPLFQKAWSFQGSDSKESIVIYKNHPQK